ncbi:MAG TPA: sigma-70 family RNA polymerase sigma factor [Terracidiphilus sp.]|jgi:RNA polymerase sigma-70 factor (ECF subfamily)
MQNGASDVLNQFRQGDVDAFEGLFRQHQRAVYGWIQRITRDPAAAEELTVETFWRIHRAHARFDPAQGFEGWARRIATRAALDWLRMTRARHTESELSAELCAEVAAPSAADPAVTAEIRSKTTQAFGRLPAKLRIAATLAVIEEQPHKEVAAALGISVAAVKLRVFRALRLLRTDLEKQGITP